MSFSAETLLDELSRIAGDDGLPARFIVAYSGGADSTALLHALADAREEHGVEILAVHVNHGLHKDADSWAAHCEKFAGSLEIPCEVIRVSIRIEEGQGVEAAARDARYAALERLVGPADWLLSAHHADDQAETLLLNLLRGSGPAGIAGIGVRQPFAAGALVRPLLRVSGTDLRDYAVAHGLDWVEDPSNLDTRFDRNYLRQELMPRLAERWEGLATRLGRSASLAGETSELLQALAEVDMLGLGSPDRLRIRSLVALPRIRQRNVLRHAIRICGLPTPSARVLQRIIDDLIPAKSDAQPLVQWGGAEARRYRGHLYLMHELPAAIDAPEARVEPGAGPVELGTGMGSLRLSETGRQGIDPQLAAAGLEVRYRKGGEEIRRTGHDCTHKLKKLLQQEGVVPWMRERIPLLYAGNDLVAVGDLWTAADATVEDGMAVQWDGRPCLY
jgi:tRNA(Ile)-lysidine synthase